MLNPMRDKNGGTYRGGEGTTPVTTACLEVRRGLNLLRVKLEDKSDEQKKQTRTVAVPYSKLQDLSQVYVKQNGPWAIVVTVLL